MRSYKAVVSVPGWANDLHEGTESARDNITTANLAYTYVPLIYRALRIRCDALIRPRLVVENAKGEEVDYPFPSDPKDMLWKSEAGLLLTGAAFVEKIKRKNSRKVADLSWVNPLTMDKVKYSAGVYTFNQKNNASGSWTNDDMVYMREFSLSDDIQPGVSSGGVALNDAALIRYMSRSVARFFETGMMPITLLQVQGLVDEDETKRIEGFFKRMTSGIKNIWRVLALNREIEPKVISQPLKDMVIPELQAQAERSVAHAFGFNPSLFDQSPNRATATEHRLSLYQDTVEPRGEWLMEQFNRQVFRDMGLKARLAFEELDIYQEDEANRSTSLMNITSAINVNPQAAYFTMTEILGYDMTDDALKIYEQMFLKKPEPPKDDKPTMQDEQPATPAPETNTSQVENKALVDLAKWQKKSIKQLDRGESAVCSFTGDNIRAEMYNFIRRGLEACKTAEDITSLFERARDMSAVTGSGVDKLLSELRQGFGLIERKESDGSASAVS